MDGQMEGRTEGWTDGQADGRTDGQIRGRTDERTDGRNTLNLMRLSPRSEGAAESRIKRKSTQNPDGHS